MDGPRFDTLTRALAVSRRGALKAALGAALAGVVSGAVRSPAAAVKEDDPFKHLGKRCKKETKCGSGTHCEQGVCRPLVCFIGGQYRPPTGRNPADPCQWCSPSDNPFGWTVMPDDFACPLDAPPSICVPAASCQAGACEPTVEPDGAPCGPGMACFRGACKPTDSDPPGCTGPDCPKVCTIEGDEYPAGFKDVEFPCRQCDPTANRTDWTPLKDQVPCHSDPDGPVQECCGGLCCFPNVVCCTGRCCSPDEQCCPDDPGCWPIGGCPP
jgi:hypothetical protein